MVRTASATNTVLGDAFAPVQAVSMFVAGREARSRNTTKQVGEAVHHSVEVAW
jgi:hypothetical protein